MFQELMPLLAQRVLVLALSRVNAEEICVNVIPRPLKAIDKDESNALTTPLSLTGTPLELDQELPSQLVEFVDAHLELSSTLKTAKEEMAAAAKTAKDAAKKPAGSKSSAGPASGASHAAPLDQATAAGEDVMAPGSTPDIAPTAITGSLFEAIPKTEC